MKNGYMKLIAIAFVSLIGFGSFAQEATSTQERVNKCVQDYNDNMALGTGYSKDMNMDVIQKFKSLFKLDAYLYWDLYKTDKGKLGQLSMTQYLDSARVLYNGLAPKVTLTKIKIRKVKEGDEKATAYFTKTNQFVGLDKKTVTNKIPLKMTMEIYSDKILIRNISEDSRATRVRSISLMGSYIVWNNLDSKMVNTSSDQFLPIGVQNITVDATPQIPLGLGIEFRINRLKYNGVTIETGISYSKASYKYTFQNYQYTYRDTIDPNSPNRFSCDVFDRSPEIKENISATIFSVPISVKMYMKNWVYAKAGLVFNINSWESDASYDLSHTGGGDVINLGTNERVYIGPEYEFDGIYGFDSGLDYDLTTEPGFKAFNVSLLVGAGFEQTFLKNFSVSLEPVVLIAPSPFSTGTSSEYIIYPETNYKTVVNSLDLPGISISPMITLRLSYFFK